MAEKEHTKDIRVDIAKQLTAIAPRVIDSVTSTIVTRGLTKRADAIVSCLDKLEKLDNDKKKIDRPDTFFMSKDKSVKDELYSEGRLKELEKLDQQIKKLTGAINKALDTGDYNDVYNLAGGKDKGGDNKGDAGTDNPDNS